MKIQRLNNRLAISISASWAWGTSLILGMEILQTKGVLPFLIWMIANCLTLAFFGWFYHKFKNTEKVLWNPIIKKIALCVQVFSLVIQLNIINSIMGNLNIDSTTSYLATAILGIVVILAMFRRGIKSSIFTDVIQWGILICTLVVLIVLGLFNGDIHNIQWVVAGGGNISWAILSAFILMSGLFGDIMHWQRAKEDGSKEAFKVSSVWFAIYLTLVAVCGLFVFNNVMNIILLISVCAVATSTIDSIAVAFHEVVNKKVGTVLAICMTLAFGLFIEMGVLKLWTNIGYFRIAFAVVIISIVLFKSIKGIGKKNERNN